MEKVYDLSVKVGSYEKDGETKNKYENIGAVMKNDDGGRFIFIKRTFNPAGVPNSDERESILVSMFEAKKEEKKKEPETVKENEDW